MDLSNLDDRREPEMEAIEARMGREREKRIYSNTEMVVKLL